MPDDPNRRKPLDASRINIHEPYELEWWSEELRVNKGKIIEAGNQVALLPRQ